MPNPNAIVSSVIRFEPPLDRPPAEMLRADRGLSVELEGERRVRLDPADPRSAGFAQILDGLRKPKKVWIQGNLYVSTKNHPDCEVWWNWHVAPTLCVRGPGLFQKQDMVIDPALFATPVSKTT